MLILLSIYILILSASGHGALSAHASRCAAFAVEYPLFVGLLFCRDGTMTTQKNIAPLYWGGLFIGIVLSFIYAQHQWVMADQLQMLEKGYLGARAGIWLSYGNIASAMGNVPGSLSAWLIGLPLLLWDSPYSPMLLLLALRLLAFVLLDRVVRELFSPTVRLAFMPKKLLKIVTGRK